MKPTPTERLALDKRDCLPLPPSRYALWRTTEEGGTAEPFSLLEDGLANPYCALHGIPRPNRETRHARR